MLLCDLQHDFVRSCVGPLAAIPAQRLRDLVAAMAEEGERQLAAEGASEADHQAALDLRYLKQYHEVTVPVARDLLARGDWAGVAGAFHAEHDRLYGYHLEAEGTGLELINVRVRSVGRTRRPELPRLARGGQDAAHARKGSRPAFVPEAGGFAELPVYDGHRLMAGNLIPGPALVERTDTTIFVSAAYAGQVDEAGSVVLQVEHAGGRA
jgi:N-methylhydantoinase A